MAWQLARPQFYKEPVIYRKKSLEETGLHYINETDSVCYPHTVSRLQNKKYLQEVDFIKEKTGRFNLRDKRRTYQLLIAIKTKFAFFNPRIKTKCLKTACFWRLPRLICARLYINSNSSLCKISIQIQTHWLLKIYVQIHHYLVSRFYFKIQIQSIAAIKTTD